MGLHRADDSATGGVRGGVSGGASGEPSGAAQMRASASGQRSMLSLADLRAALAGGAPQPQVAEQLPRAELESVAGVTRLQAQLLANRGVSVREAHAFLDADWRAADSSDSSDSADAAGPLPGQAAAVERLRLALARGERVVIYGDHDCDGVTSCAALLLALRALGANAHAYIPRREEDGRGLNEAAVRQLSAEGARLIVTTDCGSANVEEAALARTLGMEVIITDHHPILGPTPTDCILVNPRVRARRSQRDDLAGAGVAFRLAEALLRALAPARADALCAELLDLAAIGTVGDIAPMTRENWALAHAGLERMRQAPRPGLRALLALADVGLETLSERDITYVIAPRLNAAARLGEPLAALELLLATSDAEAAPLASRLDALNQERQRITEEIMVEAERQVAAQLAGEDAKSPLENPLVSAIGADWPLGMLGLVASRLTERYQRAAVVISSDGVEARGSARGLEGLNLGEALAAQASVFRRFGGHARAAGFTLASADVPSLLTALRQALSEQRRAQAAGRAGGVAEPLAVDCRMPLSGLTARIYREQRRLAPFGPGFPEPVYLCQGVRITSCWRSGAEGRNLRLRVRGANGGGEGVFFWARQGDLCESIRAHSAHLPLLDIIFTLDAFTRANGDLDLLPRISALRLLDA